MFFYNLNFFQRGRSISKNYSISDLSSMFDDQLLDTGIPPATQILTCIIYILSPSVSLDVPVSTPLPGQSELHTQPGQFTPCSKALGKVQTPVHPTQEFVHDFALLTSPTSSQTTVLFHCLPADTLVFFLLPTCLSMCPEFLLAGVLGPPSYMAGSD